MCACVARDDDDASFTACPCFDGHCHQCHGTVVSMSPTELTLVVSWRRRHCLDRKENGGGGGKREFPTTTRRPLVDLCFCHCRATGMGLAMAGGSIPFVVAQFGVCGILPPLTAAQWQVSLFYTMPVSIVLLVLTTATAGLRCARACATMKEALFKIKDVANRF